MGKKVKNMKPEDCTRYWRVPVQFIREALKAGRVDFGFAVNPSGRRWIYTIIPSKFFGYIGKDVPSEWRD